jgi:hypothetical protein
MLAVQRPFVDETDRACPTYRAFGNTVLFLSVPEDYVFRFQEVVRRG